MKTLLLQNVNDAFVVRQFLHRFKEVKEFNYTTVHCPENNYESEIESYRVTFEDGFYDELTFSPDAALIIDENLLIVEIEGNRFKEINCIYR